MIPVDPVLPIVKEGQQYNQDLNWKLTRILRQMAMEINRMQGSQWDGYHPILGDYHLWVDSAGILRIKDGAPQWETDGEEVLMGNLNRSAFGDLVTAELTPVVQLDFVYGINTQTGVSTTANSATIDTSNSRLRLQSGTNSAGSAIFRSKRPARYRAGEGMLIRFTPLFTAGVANSTQIMGVGTSADGYFVGYNGTSFGVCHRVRSSDTWVAQADWNVDTCDGTGGSGFNWNKTYGTPVQIVYPYLGYGDVKFFVQNPETGDWIHFHTIKYANTTNATQSGNPAMYFYAQALNSGNTTNLTMYCGSCGIFITGQRSFVGNPSWSTDNNKASITTETNILTLKNCTTYNGVTNTGLLRLLSISFGSSAASGIAILRIKLNATLGGSPSYTTINGSTSDSGATITSGNSITSYDTAGTTVTGGTLLASFSVDNPDSRGIDLLPYDLFLSPGDTITISAYSSNSATITASINWSEDI